MTGNVVLRALVAKRHELVSALNHHNLGSMRAGRALEHVDGTIRLFAGEPGNALVSALWMARKPLSTDELAGHVGIAPKQAGPALRYLADCGLVRSEKKPGAPVLWVATY